MDFWTSRKGLSPLIAAVLLIVVVVGIGAVVTGIVRNYVTENRQVITEKASDMKCGIEVGVNVPTVADEIRICNNTASKYINVTLENTGSADIDDLQLKVFGTSGFSANDTVWTDLGYTTPFETGDTKELVMYWPDDIGELQQVKIVPRVKVVGRSEKAFCTDAAVTYADIANC
jgi:flagellin-like protein